MDECKPLAGGSVLVVATTNRPNALDAALMRPGRLDLVLYVAPPDSAGRAAALRAGAYIRSHFSSTRALPSTIQPKLTHECLLELLKLSPNVKECKPLTAGARAGRAAGPGG